MYTYIHIFLYNVNVVLVACYLLEQLTLNLYHTLGKSILGVRIYIFKSALSFVRRNSPNVVRKSTNSLMATHITSIWTISRWKWTILGQSSPGQPIKGNWKFFYTNQLILQLRIFYMMDNPETTKSEVTKKKSIIFFIVTNFL